jgi:hypothetical protein
MCQKNVFYLIYDTYMVKVALIKENSIKYNESDIKIKNFTQENIEELFEDYVSLIDVSEEKLIETVVKYVRPQGLESALLHTGIINHFNDQLYVICHYQVTEQNEIENKKMSLKKNGIAKYFSDVIQPVYGNAIVYKIFTRDDINVPISINLNEMICEYKKKFVHIGIKLHPSGKYEEYDYMFNPVDHVSPNIIEKYKYHDVDYLDNSLQTFFDTTQNNCAEYNKIASKLANIEIFGTAYIGLRAVTDIDYTTSFKYLDIDLELFDMFLDAFYFNDTKRELYHEEKSSHSVVRGDLENIVSCENTKTTNKFRNFKDIISSRIKSLKN